MSGYYSPTSETAAPPRTLELMMGNSEQIEVDLDNLPTEEEEFDYLLGCVKESEIGAKECTRIAQEYWRRGHLANARAIAKAGIEKFKEEGKLQELPAIHYLQANLSLAYARQSPKLVLPDDEVQKDRLDSTTTQADHLAEAAAHLNAAFAAGAAGGPEILGYLTRGAQQLATRQLEEANASFEGVLSKSPHNIVALLGKARIQYSKRQYRDALRTLQIVLQLRPDCRPDPRVGIGLCFWALNEREKARLAWERSLEVNPDNTAAKLLLGLHAMNHSKETSDDVSQEDRQESFAHGSKLLTSVFKSVPFSSTGAAAANAVAEILQRQGFPERSLKLAERAIQFADTLAVVSDAHLRAARSCHDLGLMEQSMKHYSAAAEGSQNKVLAWIGKAQAHMLMDEIPAAIHTLDTLLSHRSECMEATVMLASICAHPRTGISSADAAADRKKARDIFDRVGRIIATTKNRSWRYLGDDPDMHIEIARLWQNENAERTGRAYKEAIRALSIQSPNAPLDPRLSNNLGVIKHLDGDTATARELYQDAITSALSTGQESDGIIATCMYNLARVYEEQGDSNKAREAYDKLLGKHPEYVDAKIGRARMLIALNRNDEAHQFIKQALEADHHNFNIRAFYTWYFYNSNRFKEGADFTSASLKMNSNDVYNLCAYGWFLHNTAREARQRTDEANAERMKNFTRAATSYINALTHDPACAVAAQGLAMIVAEDVLDTWAPGKSLSDAKARSCAREALLSLTKIKESLNDGSVYVNMGHCYFVRDEYERAIESYETASNKYYHGTNVSTLLYLCRSWYAKGNKDKSFSAMKTALKYAQTSLHLQPHDKSILYNIAMIEQKALEMMLSIEDASKRSSSDLEKAIEHAKHAQKLFNSLASDDAKALPYNKDIADQRRKYGENMLRKAESHLSRQQEFEVQSEAHIEAARKLREEEYEREQARMAAELEAKRQEEEARRESRRAAREMAALWSQQFKDESDEDEEKKPRRKNPTKRPKAEGGGSGDESAPKKKRGPRRKKNPDEDGDEAMTGELSATDEAPRPKKAQKKKRIVQDEDEEEDSRKRRKTGYKSKETISDSDEELDA
ncbi:hypothetical protein FRB99_006134 [Tulasnella sp. 403]|nr:hypothetical protein FRB99_006134 [Tulasnella sp. 403]